LNGGRRPAHRPVIGLTCGRVLLSHRVYGGH
jgi:hypothetical protein